MSNRCPKCGRVMEGAPGSALCPVCLLQAGMDASATTPPDKTSPYAAKFAPPSLAELAPHFPQLELLELLGQGGMGAVYKARQVRLNRLVALKILPRTAGQEAEFASRFAREAQTLAQLNHPNIVGIHDYGETAGWFHFIMEYVDGVNLRQAIQARSVEPKEALSMVGQVCDALQYAHEEGVVHRDIKPENILLDKRGRLKIADFGLAKLLGHDTQNHRLTHTHQVMGTLGYMAPEQMEGSKEVDHRADLYALGVVFYELLTGELPMGRFAPPSQKIQVDVRIDEVVLKTLEKEPERRYQKASLIKEDVERISSSAGPMALTTAQSAMRQRLEMALAVLWIVGCTLGLLIGVYPQLTYDARYFPHKLSGSDPIQLIAFYIAIFAFGPVLLYGAGRAIYRWVKDGTPKEQRTSSTLITQKSGTIQIDASGWQFVLALASFVLIGMGAGFLVWIGVTRYRNDALMMPFNVYTIGLIEALGFCIGSLLPGVIAFAFLLRLLRQAPPAEWMALIFRIVAVIFLTTGLLFSSWILWHLLGGQRVPETLSPVIKFYGEALGWGAGMVTGGIIASLIGWWSIDLHNIRWGYWLKVLLVVLVIVVLIALFFMPTQVVVRPSD